MIDELTIMAGFKKLKEWGVNEPSIFNLIQTIIWMIDYDFWFENISDSSNNKGLYGWAAGVRH